uniref:NADH-ubiquinone oxidoreductase chain 4 n=1 Tax=Janus megamaculatus TaxID=2876199 RepID=A0A8K1TMV8_9HYME|nr:NADH dehydrogenase subunit 4 [Janus megamaculatus]
MMKYLFLIVSIVVTFFFFKNKNIMFNIIFQNLFILVMIMFYINYAHMNLNLLDYYSINSMFGVDYFSFWMIMLSFWIIILMMLASMSVVNSNKFLFIFIMNLMFMILMLIMTFSVLNFMSFYLLFESCLIPTLFLILGWGYQVERIQAGIYMVMYTMFFSLPLLFILFYVAEDLGSLDMIYINYNKAGAFESCFSMLVYTAFLVKVPMFMLHTWLPKAHVEAPVAGSMVLAGVMLKLGGYGIYRVVFAMEGCQEINFYIGCYSIIGAIYLSLVCLRQVDMKALVAYSSVVHMSLMIGGLMSMEYIGVQGALLMMISHGLCSSGLFCVVNMFYERSASRSLIINKGMLIYSPVMMFMWFMLCVDNMSAPPSLNLVSEIFLLISLVSWVPGVFLLLMMLLFLSGCYSLYLYAYVCYGKSLGVFSFKIFSVREYMLIIAHLFPLNLFILKIDMIL